MKLVCLHISLFFCLTFLGQSKQTFAIKIYLEDAETNKNVSDAKVTLEGFEIPAITGKYNKEGKFYYFTEIPAGYNTVMAFHKKYNEKGFQDVDGLPKEVKLKLYDSMNVSYRFESNPYKDTTQTIYIEDPYKFGITSVNDGDYNTFRNYIINEIEKLNLNVELVNPFLEMEKNINIPLKFRGKLSCYYDLEFCKNANFVKQTEAYPNLPIKGKFPIMDVDETILPLCNEDSNKAFYCQSTYERRLQIGGVPALQLDRETNVVFFIRKKDGQKFKRYNDPLIKKIREINNINTFYVLYRKYYHNSKKGKFYKNSNTKDLDKFNNFKDIDSSKVFFYNIKKNVIRKRKILIKLFYMNYNLEFGKSCLVLERYYQNKYELYKQNSRYNYKLLEKLEKYKRLAIFDKAIGLGALDREEIICDSILKN